MATQMNQFDEIVDFVVVGSGGGSMCSSLVMRYNGKSVMILEKSSLIGGTTARSGGVMWIPNNPFMWRDGVKDSLDQAMTYLNHLITDTPGTPGSTPERRRAYLNEGPQMVEFLLAQGIRLNRVAYWPDYYGEYVGSSERGRTVIAELFDLNKLGDWKQKLRPNFLSLMAPLDEVLKLRYVKKSWEARFLALKLVLRTQFARLTGKHYVTAGAALQGRMLQAALKAGVDFRTDTSVSELIIEDGIATGVVTARDGRPHRIGARLGVLVNAGGFARNQAMRAKYQPGTSSEWSLAIEEDTGEMIVEMLRHGAAVAQMEEMVGNQIAIPPGLENASIKPVVQGVTAAPHAILVDSSGVRYMNEAGSYMAYCKGMLERHRVVAAVPSWAVFDSQYIRNYMLVGSMAGPNKPARWFEEGFLRKAETLEALATLIKVEPLTRRATVDRFNRFVAAGHDDDFNRGDRAYDRWLGDPFHEKNASLGSISEAPFYAMAVYPGDVGTFGGVVTDVQARVLRPDGSAIQGLYATGVSTASVMGRVYPGAGASVGPSFVWGYVAAKHALTRANAPRVA
jgi:3-oxosteroid 1-dehydrogenase